MSATRNGKRGLFTTNGYFINNYHFTTRKREKNLGKSLKMRAVRSKGIYA